MFSESAQAGVPGVSENQDKGPLTLEVIEEITTTIKDESGDQVAAAQARGLLDA